MLLLLRLQVEYTFTVRVLDWTLTMTIFGLIRWAWSWPTKIVASRFWIECTSTISIFQRILAHLSCYLLFFYPRTAICGCVASKSCGACTCVAMIICPRGSRHTWPLRCVLICIHCIASLRNLLARNRRLARFRSFIEKGIFASTSNLQIDNVA